jgi:RNA polymerase sigma-70 factor (ECF subfamily)
MPNGEAAENTKKSGMQEKSCALDWGTPMSRERAANVSDADEGLIARFLAGDRSAFDTLFLKYQDYVYNIVYGITGKAEEARDITQDVFLQVHRALPSFRRGSRFATWLYRIAANRAVDAARSQRRWRWLPLGETLKGEKSPQESPERAAERQSDHDTVQKVLMNLPVQHREILVLRYFQELSIEEIAEVLGCSEQAAKVRLHRARLHFKEKYLAIYGREERTPESL